MVNDNMDWNKFGSNSCENNNCDNYLASCFFSLPPKEFSLLSSMIGLLLIDNLDINQQNSLGNFLVGVGQALLTAAAQGQLVEGNKDNN